MKRILFFVSLVFSCLCVVCAGNPIKVTAGKSGLKSLMKETAMVCVEIEWSEAMYDYAQPVSDAFGDDYTYIVNDCLNSFVRGFNDNSRGLTASKESDEAKYKMTIVVDNIGSSISVRPFYVGWEAKLWGKLEITCIETGSIVLAATIDEAEDGCDTERRGCYGETFEELAETIAKLK